MKKKPLVKKTPLKTKKNRMAKWKAMREKENERSKKKRIYTRYKNDWFLSLIIEATQVKYWGDWDIVRIKSLRKILEKDYNIPINFYSAFVYYTTYNYMHWQNRQRDYSNYIGFISSERSLNSFGNYISSKSLNWRKKNTRYPPDFHEKWGLKTSHKVQKFKKDKVVKDDLLSERMKKEINKFY